ncbi:MAG: tripartite tricarboxylate transporter substrate binding protein [Rhodospirillales bacterium]|nr:tripartite tricarboxylate transporter substrate binding protein [Rhodospirillales bacterium]
MKTGLIASLAAGVAMMGAVALTPTASNAAPKFACDTAKLIVPWGPGGGTAVLFGLFEKYLNSHGASPKIKVVTIPGQAGNKGAKEAVKAKPDGCTLFAIHQSALVSFVSKRVPFNWDAFETVAHLTVTPSFVAGSPKSPYNTFDEFVAHAKKTGGNMKVGASIGATSHFFFVLMGEKAGIKFSYVPVQGGTGKRKTLLLNDTFIAAEMNEAAAGKEMKSGALKPLAIAHDKRSPAFPNVPTLKEKGIDLMHALNRGIVVPKGTSKDIINHWAAAFKKPLQDPKFVASIAAKGTGLQYMGPADYAKWFATQSDVIKKVHASVSK